MLAIKLQPKGKKHQRHFRVVVMEKKSKLAGRYVDRIGWINPHESTCAIDKEKAAQWLKDGARPTDTVHNLLVSEGILKEKKVPVHGKKKVKEDLPAEATAKEGKTEAAPAATAEEGEEKEETSEAKPEEKTEKTEEVKEKKPKEEEEEKEEGNEKEE